MLRVASLMARLQGLFVFFILFISFSTVNAQCQTNPCNPAEPTWGCQYGICCPYLAYVCKSITGWLPIRNGGGVCCVNTAFCTSQGCCPYGRICDGTGETYCCDLDQECAHTELGRAHCVPSGTAAAGAAAAAAGGPPPPPPPFGTYGGYTAAGAPVRYPGGQAGAWGGGAAGGVYPQPPGAYPNPEAPGNTGPGAGAPVNRNGPQNGGNDLAIWSLGATPQPKAILAGAPGSITFFASGSSNTVIRRVQFIIHGNVVGTASGSGPGFSASVNIGSLGLSANTLLRAVAYGPNGNKLSFATMVIPVFKPPAWLYALFPIVGTATYWTNTYDWDFSLGDGEQDPPVEDDKLPIQVSLEGSAGLGLDMSSSSGSFSLSGSGSYTLSIVTPKGDSSGSISGSLTSDCSIQATPAGYYSVVLDSVTIKVSASVKIAIPQLSWKFEFWKIAEIHIQVSVTFGLDFSVTLPASPNRKLFGLPVYVASLTLGGSIGIVLEVGAGILGVSATCEASATLSGSVTWTPPTDIEFPPPSLTLELKCTGCIDLWVGDLCKTITIFKLTCTWNGCNRDRKRAIAPSDARVLPLLQDLDFYSVDSESLLITGLRPVPSIAFVTVPGEVSMVMWRGVLNGTAQVQYAQCWEGVTDGCWYNGLLKAPYLTGPSASQHTTARVGNSNLTVLVALTMSPTMDITDELSWSTQLVSATYDASAGIWAEWTPLTPLWPDAQEMYLELKPRLSSDGSLLVFLRIGNDSTRTILSSARSAVGQWSTPVAVVQSSYAIDIFRADRAPTGEAMLIYGSDDTAYTICVMSASGSWTCLDDEPRAGVGNAVGIQWLPAMSLFVVTYPDLQLNLAVEVLQANGDPASATQLLPLGYVPSVSGITPTPFGIAVAWDCDQPGLIHYALIGNTGILRHSSSLVVNVSDVLGGEPVVLALSWTGDGLTAAGLSTGGPQVFEGSGYLFARRLPVDADAALGLLQFTPDDFSSSTVSVSVGVGNLGLMPWSGTGVSVAFALVSSSGAQTVLGSVPAPALLDSGELVNVSFSWTIKAGSSGTLRASLQGNKDTNATNDVLSALPSAIAFDSDSFGLTSPGGRVYFEGVVNSTGPGASSGVSVQIWSALAGQHPDDAVLVTTVPLSVRPGLKATVSAVLSDAQVAQIGNYVRLDAVWQGAVVASQPAYIAASAYDFALDLSALQLISVDHAHIRVGLPVLNHGLRTATHVPVIASVLHDDDSTELLTTTFLPSIKPGGNVSVLVSFTVPTSGSIQIQFEVNPVMSSGSRLLPEVWTHDNTADRTFVTRAASDGASWSSSAAGHSLITSFASATSPQTLGASSGHFTAGLPLHAQAAAWGNSAVSSGATEGSVSTSSASGYQTQGSSSSDISSAALSTGSNFESRYRQSSGTSPESGRSGIVSSLADSSSGSPSISGAQTELLGIIPTNTAARIVLAGNPDPLPYAAVVTPDSVIARVDFVYGADAQPLSGARGAPGSFEVNLPAEIVSTATLEATAYDSADVQMSSLSVVVPVLTLPPWFLALRPTVTRCQTDGTWTAVATWSTTLKGGVMSALHGSSLLDVEVIFADAPMDLVINVRSTGFASLSGNGAMLVQVKQPSGALTAPAALNVTLTGDLVIDDSHGYGNDMDLDLNSVTVSISGSASFVLPELVTVARVPLSQPEIAIPLAVQLTIAPASANFTLGKSGDALAFGGLPVTSPKNDTPSAPFSFGVSVTVTALNNVAAMTQLSAPCSVTAPINLGGRWSLQEGLVFGPASAVLSLACAVCVDSASDAGRQCTDSAPLLSWSLLRAAPVLGPLAPWSPFQAKRLSPNADVGQQQGFEPSVASRFRYRVSTNTPSWRVRIAQTDGSDMLVWTDVDPTSSLSQIYYALRPRAMPWPNTLPTILSSQSPLVQPTLAPLSRGSFLLVAVSSAGLVQAMYDAKTAAWSAFRPVFSVTELGGITVVDSAPELSLDGRLLLFTRRSENPAYTQLLSVERYGPDTDVKWRVPKTVLFDASQLASYSFATNNAPISGKNFGAMLAYQLYGTQTLSVCNLLADTWHCVGSSRAASRAALAYNGEDWVLLYSAAGSLIADRLDDDCSVTSSSSAPIAPSACSTAQAMDLTAVRSTIAGGHSVLASWRVNATFYVAIVNSTGFVSVTERHMQLISADEGALSSFALAWTTSGLVTAAALDEKSSASVGVYVLPYTAKLALRSLMLLPSGPLASVTNVMVTLSNEGAATFDPTEKGAEHNLRIAARDGATDMYTDVDAVPLTGPIPSGLVVNAGTVLSVPLTTLYGALTANVGVSSEGSVSIPLCSVSLQNAAIKALGVGLLGRAMLSAAGNCNFRVRFSAWSSIGSAPRAMLGSVWIMLTPNFNSTVNVQLTSAWRMGNQVELRVSTEDEGRPFVHNTVFASALVEVGTTTYDFSIVTAGIKLDVEYSVTNSQQVQVIATVPVQNFGSRFADNVTLDAQVESADGSNSAWKTVAQTIVGSSALGGKSIAQLSFTLSATLRTQQVRFRVNMDEKYAEHMWFDNMAVREVPLPSAPTVVPATAAPLPSQHVPKEQRRPPLSTGAMIGISIAGAVVGVLCGAVIYVFLRKRIAPPPRVLGPYVRM